MVRVVGEGVEGGGGRGRRPRWGGFGKRSVQGIFPNTLYLRK